MKKITILCAFILITVFSTGSFFIHLQCLKSYKRDFKAFLKTTRSSSCRKSIFINPSELYANSTKLLWEDENKEVQYNGVLYDILEIKPAGVRVELIAVSDEGEMAMKQEFSEIYSRDDKQSGKEPLRILKSIFQLKSTISGAFVLPKPSERLSESFCLQGVYTVTDAFIPAETPPPNLNS